MNTRCSDFRKFFAQSYQEARDKFGTACENAKTDIQTYEFRHPEPGPQGIPLYMDVAVIGPDQPRKLFVMISATHGPEGFCGSGIQTGWIKCKQYNHLPEDTGVIMIHAHNPWGFAWLVRTTHENVDLNRNFIDFDEPRPPNAVCDDFYKNLGPFPDEWSDDFFERFNIIRNGLGAKYGEKEVKKMLGYGQYSYPEGFQFGGYEPTWSRRTLVDVLTRRARKAEEVILLDFHSGLGLYGYGELLSLDEESSEEFQRSRKIFGGTVQSMPDGSSIASDSVGNVSPGIRRILNNATVTAHALEFGTYDSDAHQYEKLRSQWLAVKRRMDRPEADQPLQAYRKFYYPDTDDWKELVWMRAIMVSNQVLNWFSEHRQK